jgi:hypothetical protein
MTRGDIMDGHRRMNSADRKGFRLWFVANTVFGALAVVTLIVVTSVYSERNADSAPADQARATVHAKAR